MSSKHFIACLLIGLTSVLQYSCVDDRYDLVNKDVSTDIKITGNTVTVPLGSMEAVMLDDLIDVDDIDILKKGDDNLYALGTDDVIDPIEETIDPISISVDPVREEVDIDFTEADITSVHINAAHVEPAVFKTPTISLDDLNEELPVLQSDVTRQISAPELDGLFDILESGNVTDLPASISINQSTEIESEEVDCSFEYSMPVEVKSISKIMLTSADANDVNGTPVEVVIAHPVALADADKTLDFEIRFSDMFVLALDANAENIGKYTLSADAKTITVRDLPLNGASTSLKFYIKELLIDESDITSGGVIDVDEDIVYDLTYKVNGSIVPSQNMSRTDFNFNVKLNVPLAFRDAAGVTNDIDVAFSDIEMDFNGHFDNLEYIDHIYYIEFDEENSRIKFETIMDKDWLNIFSLKEGYALKIDFPKELEICPEHSTYEGKGTSIIYDEQDHSFYVYDLKILAESHWDLHLKKLTLDDPVKDGVYDLDVMASIYFVDSNKQKVSEFVLSGVQLDTMVPIFETLGDHKQADFVMHESDLTISDSMVHTETILSSLDTTSDFDLNEEVPTEIALIEALDFVNDVVVKLDMSISGLDDLNTDIDLDVHAALPSFINIVPRATSHSDMDVKVEGDSLFIKALYHPATDQNLWVELECGGLDFRTPEFSGVGIVPEQKADGNSYIVYSGSVVVKGDAAIHGTEFHSVALDNMHDIKLNVDFTMTDMEVKNFHGIYDGEIDAVNETIDLDLGDDLAFLHEEGNTAKLAEPQIEVTLDNSIAIPIDVDLQIFGIDENGTKIAESEINTRVRIKPAAYNEETHEVISETTKLFITSSESLEAKVGYDKVLVPELANLLTRIPESICFNMQPILDTSVTHHVDISHPLVITGAYAVNVPLKFDNFNLCYKETVEDIQSNIGETLDYFSNVSAVVKMNVLNTIPLGLKLQATPLDAAGNVIDYIVIDELTIKPGLGADILNADGSVADQEAQELKFEIKCPTGDLSELDKLELVITAATNHVAGSVGIKALQGIKLYDVVVEVTGDIETEL